MAQPSLPARANYVRLVRQSEAVTEARMDPFLDGAVLAAEQVQDVRIAILEAPKAVTATEFWTEVAITLVVESNLAGKLVSLVAKQTLGKLIRLNAVFYALPKSASGKALKVYADIYGPGVLKKGLPQIPGMASKDALKLFQPRVRQFATVASQFNYTNATVKLLNQLRRPGALPRPDRLLSATDSAGVAVVHAALEYATNMRLCNRFAHAVLEQAVWSVTTIEELVQIGTFLEWAELTDPDDREAFVLGQADIRRQIARFFETLLWARMYGFSTVETGGGNTPEISTQRDRPFPDVQVNLQDYWRDRFQADAETWARTNNLKPGRDPSDPRSQAVILRRYFAQVAADAARIGAQVGATALSPVAPAARP